MARSRSTRVSWDDLNDEQKQYFEENIANGCGPQEYPRIRKFLKKYYYGKLLRAHCIQHDYNYLRRGGLGDKIRADWDMFRFSMIDALEANDFGLMFASFVYFIAVSIFGFMFFHFGPYKTIEEILQTK